MMSRPLVFNHHALPYPDAEQARADLPDFMRTAFRCCRRYTFKLILLDETLGSAWQNIELAPGYYGRDGLAEIQRSDREIYQAFLNLITRSPLLEDKVGLEYEVGLPEQEKNLTALQAAVVYQTYLLSMPSAIPWNQAKITVWVDTLQKDELVRQTQQVPNVCGGQSLATHDSALTDLKRKCIAGRPELWENRVDLFPHLAFLPRLSGNQLLRGNCRTDIWNKAYRALEALDRFAEVWQANRQLVYQSTQLADYGMPCDVSGESASTLQNKKTRAMREFWLPTGNKVCFSEHAKLPGGVRLHFYPDTETRQLYIGYLGPHLPV
jgi:hypothetical protein